MRSVIAESGLIVTVRVDARELEPWEPEPDQQMQRRTVELALQVEDVHVGESHQQPGDSLELSVTQRARPDGRVTGQFGLWSGTPTARGTRLTAFCDGRVHDLRQALTDDHCQLLVPTEIVVDDLTAALELQHTQAGISQVVARLHEVPPPAGDMVARWAWVWLRGEVLVSPDALGRLLELAEDPATAPRLREGLLLSAHEDVSFSDEFSDAHRARLARAMVRTSLSPAPSDLRTNLLGTWLPNLVGADRDDGLPVDVVFATEPALLAALRDQRARSVGPSAEALDTWLAEGGQT